MIIKNFCQFLDDNGYEIVKDAESRESRESGGRESGECRDSEKSKEKAVLRERLKRKNNRAEFKHVHDEEEDSHYKQKKKKTAWMCSHTSRAHYARGKCKSCYLSHYHKKNKKAKEPPDNNNK